MSTRLANIIWMSLVRSIIEYGCEIWGEGKHVDLEKIQIAMGKRILRCGSRMTAEAVRGGLGWERHVARRDEMRLRYWAKLVRMSDEYAQIRAGGRIDVAIDKNMVQKAESIRNCSEIRPG